MSWSGFNKSPYGPLHIPEVYLWRDSLNEKRGRNLVWFHSLIIYILLFASKWAGFRCSQPFLYLLWDTKSLCRCLLMGPAGPGWAQGILRYTSVQCSKTLVGCGLGAQQKEVFFTWYLHLWVGTTFPAVSSATFINVPCWTVAFSSLCFANIVELNGFCCLFDCILIFCHLLISVSCTDCKLLQVQAAGCLRLCMGVIFL